MRTKNAHIIFGLGNPGNEYKETKHNAGRAAVELFAKTHKFPPFEESKKMRSLVSEGVVAGVSIHAVLPETYMNKSGEAAKNAKLMSKKQIAERLVVAHDDLDLPTGTIKIAKNRGSAGHKGVESIMRALQTRDFIRIRIGIAKKSDLTKSQPQTTVHKIVVGKLSPAEKTALRNGIKKAADAIGAIVEHGLERAMNECN